MTKVFHAALFNAQCIELDYTYTLLDNGEGEGLSLYLGIKSMFII